MSGRPYVLLSAAMSLDGHLDDVGPERLRLSDAADFDRVDRVRAESDAILVGAQTLRRDDPGRRGAPPARGRAPRGGRPAPPTRARLQPGAGGVLFTFPAVRGGPAAPGGAATRRVRDELARVVAPQS
ncbi:dihydrofolate reductase family protein, partial [Nocardia farcinica]|uniref:dihydrofolate reductase family protein n=1 Tax=Nocardia farcinica TaxID=37329 RepID=UPI002453CB07